jgi:hypothetical protein
VATDTLKAGIPVLALYDGMLVQFEAISPTTGAAITGVVVSNVAIYGDDLTSDLESGGATPVLAFGLLPG